MCMFALSTLKKEKATFLKIFYWPTQMICFASLRECLHESGCDCVAHVVTWNIINTSPKGWVPKENLLCDLNWIHFLESGVPNPKNHASISRLITILHFSTTKRFKPLAKYPGIRQFVRQFDVLGQFVMWY